MLYEIKQVTGTSILNSGPRRHVSNNNYAATVEQECFSAEEYIHSCYKNTFV